LLLLAVSLSFVDFFPKRLLTKKLKLNFDSAVFTGNHGKYTKYVSFPWPPVVAAYVRKWLRRTLCSSWTYWL